MKLLNRQTRVSADDPMGRSLDAVVVIGLFFLAGFGLDRWLGTTPLFMIVLTVVGAIGLFAKFKYAYDARMEALEAERRHAVAARRAPVADRPDTPRGEAA